MITKNQILTLIKRCNKNLTPPHQRLLFLLLPKIYLMIVIHIEHPVSSFEGWRKAFDADPIDRKSSGVKNYKLYRSTSNPNYVAIDLEFDDLLSAESALKKLQALWNQVEGTVMTGPKAQIFEVVESAKI